MKRINAFIPIIPGLGFLSVFFRLEENISFTIIILAIVTFLLFFIEFSKIIKDYTLFSPYVAWIMGFALSCVLAITGSIASIVTFLANSFGFIAAIIIILVFFTGAYILNALVDLKLNKDKRKRKKMEQEVGKKFLETVGKDIQKGK